MVMVRANETSRCESRMAQRPANCRKLASSGSASGVTTLQTLPTAQVLFAPGKPRRAYRVEQGAICHYVVWSDGRHDVIEFAFPGDIIGLGALSTHVSTAQAMVETVVSLIDEDELAHLLDTNDFLALKAASAHDVEFDYVRDRATASERGGPAKRLARYLRAALAISATEGRETDVIADEVASGYVANALGMSIDALTEALVTLKAEGVIAAVPEGLRILDADRLDELAA